jgi:hypothetical protein
VRRRFGRRSRRDGAAERAPIDAARICERLLEGGVVEASALEPLDATAEGIPDNSAIVARGRSGEDEELLVGFAPRAAGDALLAVLAVAARLAQDEGFSGEALAVAPRWSTTARRRLALVGELPFRFRAVLAPALDEQAGGLVDPEPLETPPLSPDQVAGQLVRPADRELFARAAAALQGLASKHGGAVRGAGRAVELVVLARRVAELRADEGGVLLHILFPQKSSTRLGGDGLSEAFDRLEGDLRRRLNDRRTRDGEEGLRARAIPLIAAAQSLRAAVAWPIAPPAGGSEAEVLDLAGVDAEGRCVVGAARERVDLETLGAILDAAASLRASLPALLAHAGPPLRLDAPRLVLAAQEFAPAVRRVLPLLALPHELLELLFDRSRNLSVASIGAGEAAASRAASVAREEPPAREEGPTARSEGRGGAPDRRGRGRRRGRRRRPGSREAGESGDEEREEEGEEAGGARSERPAFEELSFFDLEDDADAARGEGDEGASRRRRGRSRRRRRGGRGRGDDGSDDEASPRGPAAGSESGAGARVDAAEAIEGAPESDEGDDEEPLARLVEDLPDFEEVAEPRYDEDEEEAEEGDPELERLALEREKRRRARLAKAQPEPEVPAPPPRPPRRRAALVVHADRDSILAGILLARDIRLLEGFWIYPQSELMTFFRSVATDLREEAPIYVVGFTPSPARDVVQAAALYRDRLTWFDHHDWPPEDLLALRQAIGEEAVHLTPGAGSSLPAVLTLSTRRSRFSDKLVDLGAARFTQHDYERWGGLWWRRLSDLAGKSGERRHALDPLLIGRPSDLAREAARAPRPPTPEELRYVSERDFRLVYFAGYSLVVVDAPAELDLHLCARIARERYGAPLSLASVPGEELVVLAGDELSGRRSLDLGSLVDHLAAKLEWVEALPDDDHVARFRVRDLASHPERLDEVIGEIAMGRSILEG